MVMLMSDGGLCLLCLPFHASTCFYEVLLGTTVEIPFLMLIRTCYHVPSVHK
jgi:hypothetical protein